MLRALAPAQQQQRGKLPLCFALALVHSMVPASATHYGSWAAPEAETTMGGRERHALLPHTGVEGPGAPLRPEHLSIRASEHLSIWTTSAPSCARALRRAEELWPRASQRFQPFLPPALLRWRRRSSEADDGRQQRSPRQSYPQQP